ncbi:MAG TPA: hypothetical protein VK731_14155, partial [Candidatus Cybelea sp.]|nr:hypothetical protein [Candidatus Cybelea sp.]
FLAPITGQFYSPTIFCLPVGIGLLRLNWFWRKCALVSVWLGYALLVILLFVLFSMANGIRFTTDTIPFDLFGWKPNAVQATWAEVTEFLAIAALLSWMHIVLMRPKIKALFELQRDKGNSRLETLVVIALVLFTFTGPWTNPLSPAPSALPTPSTNLVVNGSFEQPPIMAYADGQLWANVPTEEMKPWQTDAPYFEVWSNGYAPPNGEVTTYFAPCCSPDGAQNLEIISAPAYQASVWQTVPTVPGTRYAFSFQHTPRPGAHSTLAVSANDDVVERFDEDGTVLTNFQWALFTTNFVASSNLTTVRFSDETSTLGQGTHLDSVVLLPFAGVPNAAPITTTATPSTNQGASGSGLGESAFANPSVFAYVITIQFVLCAVVVFLIVRRVRRKASAARKPIWPWAFIAAIVVVGDVRWLSQREPADVWLPDRISDSIGEQFGEAQIRVTDVSQRGQVVLVKFVCETPLAFADRELFVRYSGPIFDYPPNITSTVTNVDCLISPTVMNGGGDVLAGSRDMRGAPSRQIGFVLPDDATAARVVEQMRTTHLGKPRGLTEKNSALLLFSLHRNVGKDASGKPVTELLDAELCLQAKNPPGTESPNALSFGPVIQRTVTLADANPYALVVVNLEKGEVTPAPVSLQADPADPNIFHWNTQVEERLEASGADLALNLQATGWGFVPLGARMILHKVDDESPDSLNQLTPERLRSVINNPESIKDYVLCFSGQASAYPCSQTFAFKTRRGTEGVLNITGFTGNPPGVRLRYKLLQSGAANTPASQNAAPAGNSNFAVTSSGVAPLTYQWNFSGTNPPTIIQASVFGPVIERTVTDSKAHFTTEAERTNALIMIDFASGSLFAGPPAMWADGTSSQEDWMKAREADAMAIIPHANGLLCLGMKAFSAQSSEWDESSAASALRQLKYAPMYETFLLSGRTNSTTTWIFQTRKGATGILQLLGITADGRGVRLRYKLLQNSASW